MTAAACVWLGLFPLLSGFTYETITRDKWNLMLLLTGLTVLLRSADAVRSRSRGCAYPFRLSLSSVTTVLLLMWLVCTTLTGGRPAREQWIGCSSRREGLLTRLCYLTLFFCFQGSRIDLSRVLHAVTAGVTVFGIIALIQRGGGNPLGLYPQGKSYATSHEFQGTVGNIDMCSGYLTLVAALSLTSLFRKETTRTDRIFCGIGALWSLTLILMTGVRSGWIALGVLALFLGFARIPRRLRLPAFGALLLSVFVLVWFWPGQSGSIWELHEILHGRLQLSFGGNRIAVWLNSLRLFRESPLTGGGCDSFMPRFNEFLNVNGIELPASQGGLALPRFFDNPHNEYLALLTNNGLPALLLYLLLLIAVVYPVVRSAFAGNGIPQAPAMAVLCYAVQAFFSFSVCIVTPMFWVLCGLADNSLSRRFPEHVSSGLQRDRDLYKEERSDPPSL